jgi:hypothetical protein
VLDIGAHPWKPNATAYKIDPDIGGGHISKLAGEITSTAPGKPALLGHVEADPDDEWWLAVVD